MISRNQIKLIRSLELKKNRRREQLFVAEGPKVIGDLLRGGYQAHSIFATRHDLTGDHWPTDIQPVTDEELRRISFLQHPQEVLALMKMPTEQPLSYPTDEQLSLALDGVQDPGNMGTIVRVADWFGIDTIYCSMDTADVYNPKVVQATMGSLAHVKVVYGDLADIIRKASCPVYGTLLDGQNIYEQTLTKGGLIVMGNEGNGISASVRELVTHRLLIPNYHQGSETAESLNVAIATAITCAEFRRSQPLSSCSAPLPHL